MQGVGYLNELVDIERTLLCGLFLQAKDVMPLIPQLEAKHFFIEKHGVIFRTVQTMYLENLHIDLLTVAARLRLDEKLEKIGGRTELASIHESMWSGAPKALTELIIDGYKKRRIAEIGSRLAEVDYFSETKETIAKLEIELRELTSSDLPPESSAMIGEFVGDYYTHLEKLASGEADLQAAPTGFYDLDTVIGGGFGKGELVTIAGRSGMGKTAFALQCAYYFASVKKQPTLLFSLEMTKTQLTHRLNSFVSRTELSYLLSGRISQNQWGNITNALDEIAKAPLIVLDRMAEDWRSVIAEIRNQHAKNPLGLVVIDYLQLMAGGGEKANWVIESVTRTLKLLAVELNIPIVILSQLNRGVESQSNKRPSQADLRGSGAIEQDSDKVIAIYRDDYYNPDSTERGIAEILVLKNRMGPTGTVKLLFDAQFTAFKNLARANY